MTDDYQSFPIGDKIRRSLDESSRAGPLELSSPRRLEEKKQPQTSPKVNKARQGCNSKYDNFAEGEECKSPGLNCTSNLRKLTPVAPPDVSTFNSGTEKPTLSRIPTCRNRLDCDSSCGSTYNSTCFQNSKRRIGSLDDKPPLVDNIERQLKEYEARETVRLMHEEESEKLKANDSENNI